jgi:hypothetical protein
MVWGCLSCSMETTELVVPKSIPTIGVDMFFMIKMAKNYFTKERAK